LKLILYEKLAADEIFKDGNNVICIEFAFKTAMLRPRKTKSAVTRPSPKHWLTKQDKHTVSQKSNLPLKLFCGIFSPGEPKSKNYLGYCHVYTNFGPFI